MTLRLTFMLLLLAGVARAQDDTEEVLTGSEPFQVTALTLVVENDTQRIQLVGESDRWYSSGIKLDLSFNRPWPGFTSKLLPFGSIASGSRFESSIRNLRARLARKPWRCTPQLLSYCTAQGCRRSLTRDSRSSA